MPGPKLRIFIFISSWLILLLAILVFIPIQYLGLKMLYIVPFTLIVGAGFGHIYYFVFSVMNKKNRAQDLLYSWDWMKRYFGMKIDKEYASLPGEKELFPMTPCYIEQVPLTCYPRDVIVTNLRIILGFHKSIFWYQAETFKELNFWHPAMGEIPPNTGMFGPLSILGNRKINSITLEEDRSLGKYIRVDGFSIYHPEAESIYRIFSSPLKKNAPKKKPSPRASA